MLKPVRQWIQSLIDRLAGRPPAWEKFEYFDVDWKKRISMMAREVKPGDVVMDLGCGPMWLREYLPDDAAYIPVDYKPRDEHTIVCDFNARQFPDRQVDLAFISGCLEYVHDVDWFIGSIAAAAPRCVISYCTTDVIPDRKCRTEWGWVNHMTEAEFLAHFTRHGMHLVRREQVAETDPYFVLEHDAATASPQSAEAG